MLLGDAQNILLRDLFHVLFDSQEEISRVTEVLIRHQAIDNLALRVEVEDKGVQEAVLGQGKLLVRDFAFPDLFNFSQHRSNCINRRFGLGLAADVKLAGVVIVGRITAVNRIGQALARAHVLKQPPGETTAENSVHDNQREIVGVAAQSSYMPQVYIRLIDIIFANDVNRLAKLILDLRRRRQVKINLLPSIECLLDFLNHLPGVEVTPDRQHCIVGSEVFAVEINQVVPANAADSGVLDMPGVDAVCTVNKLVELAAGNRLGRIIAPGNRAGKLHLSKLNLVLAKGRIHQHVGQNREPFVKVSFEHRHGGRARVQSD